MTLALLLDDLQALVASGRTPAFIAVFSIAYVTVILTIWLPKWSWAFVAAVVAASAFVAILAPVLFVVVAAGYALPMIGANRQAAQLVISNHIPRSKREQPTVAVRRCTTVLARIAAEQGATLTAGPIDDRWQLELVLVGSRRIADPCAADAPLRVSWVRHDRAVGAPCVPVPRFELDLRNVPS